jgi:hypothetical protein
MINNIYSSAFKQDFFFTKETSTIKIFNVNFEKVIDAFNVSILDLAKDGSMDLYKEEHETLIALLNIFNDIDVKENAQIIIDDFRGGNTMCLIPFLMQEIEECNKNNQKFEIIFRNQNGSIFFKVNEDDCNY